MNELRPQLFDIAYRMLGSAAEAEELVQDAFERWAATEQASVASPKAFLSTMVTRLSLDRLKSASVQRTTYVGPWLPEPLHTRVDAADSKLEVSERISLAFLLVLETLSPAERAVFLLHEVFDYDHDDAAKVLGRSPAACRKLLERARKAVAAHRPRFAPSREAHRSLVEAFIKAVDAGDAARLTELLHENVRSDSDGGGKATAARRPLQGRDEVLRLWANMTRMRPPDFAWSIAELNGWPAVVVTLGGKTFAAIQLETDGERIHAIRSTLNPDKLARV